MIVDVLVGARLLWGLPAFLRKPLSLPEAQATLRRRLECRGGDFLDLARWAIYDNPRSPYRQLLDHAGCEYGDLERVVRSDGLEAALRTLCDQGVYLTLDELKGRRPVVRGALALEVEPSRFWNPAVGPYLLGQSSGSRGARLPVPIDLASTRDLSVNLRLFLAARRADADVQAIWTVPGGWPIDNLLRFMSSGVQPARWFSQVDPSTQDLPPRYRWSVRVLRWGSFLAGGVSLPAPEHVPVDEPLPIVRWLADTLRQGRTPHLWTFVSSAVRLCHTARAAGIDLAGARFTVSGEPVTETRMVMLRAAGVDAVPRYGSIECGQIGLGCLAPAMPGELHLMSDLHAVIEAPEARTWPAGTILFSSLRRTARMILLNASLGDQAVVSQRACGCPLEELGWTTHICQLRSGEKVTSGGMNFLDADLLRVLDEVLPARFGGAPTHYQLIEEEAGDGRPRLRLLVHPAVGPVDIRAVAETFLAAIGARAGSARVTQLAWREAGVLAVERRAPVTTASGKILHCHVDQRPSHDGAAIGSGEERARTADPH